MNSEITKMAIRQIILLLIYGIICFAFTIAILVWSLFQNNIMCIIISIIGNCAIFGFLIFLIVWLIKEIKQYKKEKEIEQ